MSYYRAAPHLPLPLMGLLAPMAGVGAAAVPVTYAAPQLPEPYHHYEPYPPPMPTYLSHGPLLVQYSLNGPPRSAPRAASLNTLDYRFVDDDSNRPRKKQKKEPLTLVLRFQDRSDTSRFKDSYKQHGKRLFPDSHEKFPVAPLPEALQVSPPELTSELSDQIYPSIVTKKYSASALGSNRSHLLVYEYPLATQWVIWDYETGYTHLTGLWRAALHEHALHRNKNGVVHVKPNAKADIVKLLESTPQALHPYIKRVRGGFLKIQGTWVPHSLCKRLARSFCYYIRYQLVPIFGPDFPDLCLRPEDPGFGELRFDVCGDALDFSIDIDTSSAGSELCPISPTLESGPQFSTDSTSYYTGASQAKVPERLGSLSLTFSRLLNENQPSFLSASLTLTSVSSVEQLASQLPDRPAAKRDDELRMSYADMVDIVNASKCLQRLRQGLCSEEHE